MHGSSLNQCRMQMGSSEKRLFFPSFLSKHQIKVLRACLTVDERWGANSTSNLKPECAVTNWMSAGVNYRRSMWCERKTPLLQMAEPELWTDSALPWFWEPQLSSLLSIPVVQIAQSLLLTRYVMAFCPPSLYFLHFKVVDKGRSASTHNREIRRLMEKHFFRCREEAAIKTRHVAPNTSWETIWIEVHLSQFHKSSSKNCFAPLNVIQALKKRKSAKLANC